MAMLLKVLAVADSLDGISNVVTRDNIQNGVCSENFLNCLPIQTHQFLNTSLT